MKYDVKALVNYPDEKDVDTPDYNGISELGVQEFVRRLINKEKDATSFVITIVVKS